MTKAYTTNQLGVMIEEMRGDIKLLIEVVVPMRREVTEMRATVDRIPTIEADIKTIKAAVTAANLQVADHDRRLSIIENRQ